jgi:hypothetical protein
MTATETPAETMRRASRLAAEEKREAARPVLVRDWMDLFVFETATEIMCPDCEVLSPELGNVFAAAKWAEKHSKECPANTPEGATK